MSVFKYTNSQPRLKEAISLVKIGRKTEARQILREILQLEPLNEPAWMWYLDTLQSDRERLKALENYLMANPESEFARKGVVRLRELCPPTIPKPVPIRIPPELNEQPVVVSPPVPPFPLEEKPPDRWLVIAVVCLLALTVFVSIGLAFALPAFQRGIPSHVILATITPTLIP